MRIAIVFIIGLAFMLFLMIKCKINPFFALTLSSLLIGIGCGLEPNETISLITSGIGGTCTSLALVVILGSLLGEYIERSYGTQRIASSLLNVTGNNKADIALGATGFLVSIPVFCDVCLVILSPLVKAISKKSGKAAGPLATVLACCLLTTNTFVAPTAAPVATATGLNLDLGVSIIWGLLASMVICVAILTFSRLYLTKKPVEWWGRSDSYKGEDEEYVEVSEEKLPGFWQAFFPILVPIILIILNTVFSMIFPEDAVIVKIFKFMGNKNLSLAFGILAALILLYKKMPAGDVTKAMGHAIDVSGPIIFITAGGGALAKIIAETGMGQMFADVISASAIPVILVPFLITGLSKFAQGSASVAVVLGASMTLPLCEAGLIHPVVAFLAICAGSQFGSHVNNSFFWVFANLFEYDTKTTLKSLCLAQHIMAGVGLIFAAIVSLFLR